MHEIKQIATSLTHLALICLDTLSQNIGSAISFLRGQRGQWLNEAAADVVCGWRVIYCDTTKWVGWQVWGT